MEDRELGRGCVCSPGSSRSRGYRLKGGAQNGVRLGCVGESRAPGGAAQNLRAHEYSGARHAISARGKEGTEGIHGGLRWKTSWYDAVVSFLGTIAIRRSERVACCALLLCALFPLVAAAAVREPVEAASTEGRADVHTSSAPEGPLEAEAESLDTPRMVPLTKALAPPTGDRMLIMGSISMGLGLAGQMIGFGWMHRACSKIVDDEFQDPSFQAAVSCGVGFAAGGATLFMSGIPQILCMPWIIAGITQRGRRRAFEDELMSDGSKRARRPGLVSTGSVLLGAGVVLWVVAPIAAFRHCGDDPSITCSLDTTTWGWNLGLAMVTGGSAMLGYGVAYKRSRKRFSTIRAVKLSPTWGRRGAGFTLHGRF